MEGDGKTSGISQAAETLREVLDEIFAVEGGEGLFAEPGAGAVVLAVLVIYGLFGWKAFRVVSAIWGAILGASVGFFLGAVLAAGLGSSISEQAALWLPRIVALVLGIAGSIAGLVLQKICMFLLAGALGAVPGLVATGYGGDWLLYGGAAAVLGFVIAGLLAVRVMRVVIIFCTSTIAATVTGSPSGLSSASGLSVQSITISTSQCSFSSSVP